ncbi:PAS domain S-box protein [bacterium]|nr:PAS domain S-box protein [bacterium]
MTDKPTKSPGQEQFGSPKHQHENGKTATAEPPDCENRFVAFFANSMDALFITRPDGQILQANPAACQMLGYSEKEIIALGRAGVVDGTDKRLPFALDERRKTGRYVGELNFIHKNGDIVPTEIATVIFKTATGEERASIIARDLTKKKLLEEEDIRQRKLNQTLLNALPCVALLLKPMSREIVAMNKAAERAGCTIGKTCYATWPKYLSPCSWCPAPTLWATGKPQHLEVEGQGIIWDAHWIRVSDDLYLHYAFDITEHKNREQALRDNEEFTKTVMDHLPIGLAVNSVDPSVSMIYMNDNFARFYRTTRESLQDPDSFWEAVYEDPVFREEIKTRVLADCASGDPGRMRWENIPLTRRGQETHYICAQNTPVLGNSMMLSTVWDVTARMRMEIELSKSEEQYRTLFESIEEGFCVIQALFDETGEFEEYRVLETNPAFDKYTGLVDKNGKLTSKPGATDDVSWYEIFNRIVRTGKPERFEKMTEATNGWFDIYAFLISPPQEHKIAILFQNISARKQAEAERERLQTQLMQAQKLESVGRLAGGVAHDYNNMLSVIIGFTELARSRIDQTSPLWGDLQEVFDAAQRSAGITQQLLAFARKQVITPELLDLNETIEGSLKMLRRLIGENISLEWHPGANLSPVMLDSSQINQILANLCVNSRDAIGDIGKISIKTGMVKRQPHHNSVAHVGETREFVMLLFSDNGCGMSEETRKNIFEPFFTTKDPGKGTGLGLATIYGIVEQNSGFIDVISEPGQGTTFQIYFPKQDGRIRTSQDQQTENVVTGHGETILIVEDEASILRLGRTILEKHGYQVLTASSPVQAVNLAENHHGALHLLLTDVIMPEMNGRDLVDTLSQRFPQLKSLYMSGYTSDIIGNHGILTTGVNFIQKPFSKHELLQKVREVLDLDTVNKREER